MQLNDKDHYELFQKRPDISRVSEDTKLYKKFVPVDRNICFLTEYFKFEERKRQGFTSKYLTINPYESDFAEYVEMCQERDKDLPASVAHSRLLAELELFHKRALASIK